MTTTTSGRAVDAATLANLQQSYLELRRYGVDSVSAAWRFGQRLNHYLSPITGYTRGMLGDALGISGATVTRYTKLFEAYQRPELAVEASRLLETYDVGIITELHDQLGPVGHARPYAGRRYRYVCQNCHHVDVARVEIDPETEQPLDPDVTIIEPEVVGVGVG